MLKKNKKYLIGFGVLVSILCLTYLFHNFSFDSLGLEDGMLKVAVFIIMFVILSLIGVSVTPLIILGGTLFKFHIAFLVTFLSLYTASIVAFYLGHYITNIIDSGHHFNSHFKFKAVSRVINKIDKTVKEDCFKTVFLSKFIIPNIVVSYSLGSLYSHVDQKKFYVATFLNNLILCAGFVFLGSIFAEGVKYLAFTLLAIGLFYVGRFSLTKKHF